MSAPDVPTTWEAIDAVFQEALDRPPEARAAYLDDACSGRPRLRAAVAKLLAASEETSVLDDAPGPGGLAQRLDLDEAPEAEDAATEALGRRVGAYHLVEVIGEGGMGHVYRAERADGAFDQEVAVKLFAAAAAGSAAVALQQRFAREQQVLAGLVHPHIARLYDGGVTAEGQPYFAMEYVDGEPLDAYCDARRLDIEARLRLFCDVAATVHYAHRNLVIHRDLKPSNILVQESDDGTPVVKLLDFGIAKLIDAEAGEVGVTRTGERWMTPEYAAPEQIKGAAVTTATDVYQLGVLLYELLTGQRPYGQTTTSVYALQRAVIEDEPTRPSTAVVRTEDEADPVALSAARQIDPQRLRQLLSGDLDAIVLKALRKEPEARYASAEAFLEDVRRYLAGEPVKARQGSTGYRLRKFVGRHRGAAAAVAGVAMLIVGFAVAMALQQAETARERDRAEQEAAKARQVTTFFLNILGEADPTLTPQGDTLTVTEAVQRAVTRIDTARLAPGVQAEVLDALGLILTERGQLDAATEMLERAVAVRRGLPADRTLELAESLQRLGFLSIDLAAYEAADSLLHEALQLRSEAYWGDLSERDLAVADVVNSLAILREKQGRYADADSLFNRVLPVYRRIQGAQHPSVGTLLSNLGVLASRQGRYPAADSLLREALTIYETVYRPDHPSLATVQHELGNVATWQARYAEAEAHYREALAIREAVLEPEHPDRSYSLAGLASALQGQLQYDEAEALFRQALALQRDVLGYNHQETLSTQNLLSALLMEQGRYAEAEALLREAVVGLEQQLGRDHPFTAGAANDLGVLLARQQRYDAAEDVLQDALARTRRGLRSDHPYVAIRLNNVAFVLEQQGRYADAAEQYREAVAIGQSQYGPEHINTLTFAFNLASALHKAGAADEAEPLYRTAAAQIQQQLSPEHPVFDKVVFGSAKMLMDQGHAAEAEALARAALAGRRARFGEASLEVARACELVGRALVPQGKPAEAVAMLQEAEAILQEAGDQEAGSLEQVRARLREIQASGSRS